MSYFFTDFFRSQLVANQAIMNGVSIKLVLFRYAPSMSEISPKWSACQTVAQLTQQPGWVEVSNIAGYPLTHLEPMGNRLIPPDGTGSRYVTWNDYKFTELSKATQIEAFGAVATIGGVTDALIFVSNTPLGGIRNIRPADALTSSPDSTLGTTTNRWLFSWDTGGPEPIEGPLALSLGSPDFEESGTQWVWMYPQRVNMIADPSFEKAGSNMWSTNGTLTRVSGGAPGADPLFNAWSGQFAGTAPVIAESNLFATRFGETDSEQWTVQLMAKGDGVLKVGLVYWDGDYRATLVNWGEPQTLADGTVLPNERWNLSADTWTHIAVHRHVPEAHLAMVRLELQGTTLTIDRVLAERGYLKDWLYFDGDENFGLQDDFCWYGGSNRSHKTYSLWYNHRHAVTGRLFAIKVDPNDPGVVVTDEEVEEAGLVYRWVPAGISVNAEFDVLYPFDVRNEVPTKQSGVLPYQSSAEPNGVYNPWTGL